MQSKNPMDLLQTRATRLHTTHPSYLPSCHHGTTFLDRRTSKCTTSPFLTPPSHGHYRPLSDLGLNSSQPPADPTVNQHPPSKGLPKTFTLRSSSPGAPLKTRRPSTLNSTLNPPGCPNHGTSPRTSTTELIRSAAKSSNYSVLKKPKHTNLLPFQSRALSTLALRTDVLVVSCDKNLGPALIDTSTYVERAFTDHLDDTRIYKRLTEDEAKSHMDGVATKVRK